MPRSPSPKRLGGYPGSRKKSAQSPSGSLCALARIQSVTCLELRHRFGGGSRLRGTPVSLGAPPIYLAPYWNGTMYGVLLGEADNVSFVAELW